MKEFLIGIFSAIAAVIFLKKQGAQEERERIKSENNEKYIKVIKKRDQVKNKISNYSDFDIDNQLQAFVRDSDK